MRWFWLVMCVACAREESNPAFDRYRQPDKLVAALRLQPGNHVADVGAGRGYLTHRLAKAVGPTGQVVATDIDFAALQQIGESKKGEAIIEIRRVVPDEPSLEAGAYDLILLSEVDQYLPDRARYLSQLVPALKPGGRIAVCNRRNYRAPLLAAAQDAHLATSGEYNGLPAHFLLFLEPR